MKNKKLFSSIIGYEGEKKTLGRIVDVLNNQEKYKKLGCSIPHGLLLYGPPGLGKTTLAKEILKSIKNRKSYIIRKTKSDGSFIDYMSSIFKEAKDNQPSIILLDDLDKFSNEDDGSHREEFVVVQSLIDDIKDDNIFVIATANDRDTLPDSLKRSGRFDVKMYIDYPEEKEAYEIIKYYLHNKELADDVNIKNISYILGCVSCADIEKVCNQAGIYAGFKNKKKIDMEELVRASLEHSYNTNIESIDSDNEYSIETAYHEAGHTLVSEILEQGSVNFVTIADTDSDTKGFTKIRNNDYYFQDIKFMENRVISLLAGRAATEIIFNKVDIGSKSDLSRAFCIIHRFMENCVVDFNTYIYDKDIISENVKKVRDDDSVKLITNYYNKAKKILLSNRNKLDNLANILNKKKILFKDEIEEIIL